MFVRRCHLAVFAILTCLLCCTATDPPAVVSAKANVANGTGTASLLSHVVAQQAIKAENQDATATSIKPDVHSESVPASQIAASATHSTVDSTTVKPSGGAPVTQASVKDDPITVTVPTPSTVKPDPDPTPSSTVPTQPTPPTEPTTKPTTSTTPVTPPTTPTTKPTVPTTPSTAPTKPTSPTSPTIPTSSTSEKPTVTTPKTNVTTPTPAPVPAHHRQFDGPSFFGGIVLASGLMAIAFVAFKFYKARTERNYHTL